MRRQTAIKAQHRDRGALTRVQITRSLRLPRGRQPRSWAFSNALGGSTPLEALLRCAGDEQRW